MVRCVLIFMSAASFRRSYAYSSIYQIPDGKPENSFAFSGEAKNMKYAAEIILECHDASHLQ